MEQILKALTGTEASYLQQLLSKPIDRLILHSDIELSEEEICEAIIRAKSEKGIRIQYEQNETNRRNQSKNLMKVWNNVELIEYCHIFYAQRFDVNFEIDKNNSLLVHQLSLYFTNDTEFEKAGYSLKKGVMVMGNVGTGKTEIMRFFQKNKKKCFKIISCVDISDEFSIYKSEIADIYSTPIDKPLHDASVFFQKDIGYCFDDLGTEEVKNDYGNKKNVMADVLMAVYNKKQYHKFFITTNLKSKEEIEAKYGTRVNSRLREMFNVFVLDGTDRRK